MNARILSPFHKKVLSVFASIEESQAFYFTGAMALAAYHLGHRVSEDIDVFCPTENLIPVVAGKFTRALAQKGIGVQVTRSFGSFWEAVLKEGNHEIRFQLAYDSPFRLDELSVQDGLHVHSLNDLAAGKLLALFSRAEERDFIDVYCLVRDKGFTIEKLIELARRKDPGLDDYYLAIAFQQVERLPDDPGELKLNMLGEIDLSELKAFFKQQAVAILDRHL